MDREFAEKFAQHWVSSWNSHDLQKVLSHYTDDFEMASPIIRERLDIESGVLKGKAQVREYWEKGLEAFPNLHFKLVSVFLGSSSVIILYEGHKGMSCECFKFNEAGLVYEASAHYE